MDEKPLIIFPEAQTNARHKRNGRPSNSHFPSPSRQVERLQPKFAQLEKVFSSGRAELRTSAVGTEAEKVLVLETIGKIKDFVKALKDIEGLEWLADVDEEEISSDDDFYNEKDRTDKLSGRVYLIMSNQAGLKQLLSLWAKYLANPDAPEFKRGYTKWRDLFNQLKEIRHWGVEDRLRETGILEDWQERIALNEEKIRFEIELWYREKPFERIKAENIIKEQVNNSEGNVISSTIIHEIAYHGMLIELPIGEVKRILENPQTRLIQIDQIMFFKPVGQTISITPDDDPAQLPPAAEISQEPIGEPVVALLDGLPLSNHNRLRGHLRLEDPDEFAKSYSVQDRAHGTFMASLIINGELDANEKSLTRPIYARPVLQPGLPNQQNQRRETLPDNVQFIDLLWRSIKRLFEGEGQEPAVAPNVKIINLSIGVHPFYSNLSSLAKLIDFLSWKYKVLFIISAGNYTGEIELDIPRNELSVNINQPLSIERLVFNSINGNARLNRLYSPSEAINGLTVGAVHEDCSTLQNLGRRINPYFSTGLPSPINAQGPGFRRAIKPDILLPGGRQTYREKFGTTHTNATLQIFSGTTQPPGQLVASPGTTPGDINGSRYICGTSNAAALTTRTAAQLYEKLLELKNEPGGERLDDNYFAVLLKALLVHGAKWGDTYNLIERILGRRDKQIAARLLGYGKVQTERLFSCTDQRATLLGFGELKDEQAHVYRIPIPQAINGQRTWRRIIVTLAWFTPTNTKHNAYRRAALWFSRYGATSNDGHFEAMLQVERKEADGRDVIRGTVQHEIFEGEQASSFEENAELQIQVNCRADAGNLEDKIPYGLVFTIEVAEGITLPIYQEIVSRIRPRIEINPNAEDFN